MNPNIVADEATRLSYNARALANHAKELAIGVSGAIAPDVSPFIFLLAIFLMACFVGYYVVWNVTPVQGGTFTVHYRVAAGLQGKAKAVTADGSAPQGEFVVRISTALPHSRCVWHSASRTRTKCPLRASVSASM